MKKLFVLLLASILAVPAVAPAPAFAQSDAALSLQQSFSQVADQFRPVVVSVTTKMVVKQAVPQNEFFFGDPFEFFFDDFFNQQPQQQPRQRQAPKQKYYERKFEGGGTGVVIDPKGYVLTNFHVIDNADEISIHFADKDKSYDAKLVGKDPFSDLAVIKIESSGVFEAAKLGDSDNLKVGDWVIAIGSPFGLEQTVTAGIVSAKRQSLDVEGKRYENMIQTDAAINRGNSGGPLVNIRGEVIGINTAIYAPTGVFSGIGFAIPINKAKEILSDLIEKGKVVRGWLGVEIKEVDDAIVKQFGLKDKSGVLVNKVTQGSAAEKAGIQRGDVITAIDGEKIKDTASVQKFVRSSEPGKVVKVMVNRSGKEIALSAKLGEMPDGLSQAQAPASKETSAKTEWNGLTVETLTPELAKEFGISGNEKGAVVTAIDGEKMKFNLGLREGDLVKGLNRQNIAGAEDFKKIAEKINLKEGVVLDIVRNGNPMYMTFQQE